VFGNAYSPLIWLVEHEQQFFNISHLAWQFMGIIDTQIKIERVFGMGGVIEIFDLGLKI
jgi:hypothetical protein